MPDSIYIFAGGGTGGHLYPALAVADELTRRDAGARIVFACSQREIDRRILDPRPYGLAPQPVQPLPRRPGAVWSFVRTWRASRRQLKDMIRDLRPRAVLGTGGYAAGPAIVQARRERVPTALLNPDAVPGIANRYLARRAEAIFTQFQMTADALKPSVRDRVHCVGCPIRPSLLDASRAEAREHFDLSPDRRTLLILGGSLGAASINQAVAHLAAEWNDLAETWQLLHITGPGKGDASADPRRQLRVRTLEYCDRMDLACAAADVAVCRAGASTVAELAATGTPAVFLPYPYHRDEHQRHNAAALAQSGGAVICDDARDPAANADRLRQCLLPLLRDPGRCDAMAEAAARLGRPSAAAKVADWLASR